MVQVRDRTRGPLGFNVNRRKYNRKTNDSDLDTSLQVLKMLFVDSRRSRECSEMHRLITYGGRVTKRTDRRYYNAFLNLFHSTRAATPVLSPMLTLRLPSVTFKLDRARCSLVTYVHRYKPSSEVFGFMRTRQLRSSSRRGAAYSRYSQSYRHAGVVARLGALLTSLLHCQCKWQNFKLNSLESSLADSEIELS